jgi:hypothetical protein
VFSGAATRSAVATALLLANDLYENGGVGMFSAP